MSLFRRLMIVLGAGGAGYQAELRKDANIFSDYNLCSSVQVEEIVAALTSLATLSISDLRLIATDLTSIYTLSISDLDMPPCQLASVYDLSTAVTE